MLKNQGSQGIVPYLVPGNLVIPIKSYNIAL